MSAHILQNHEIGLKISRVHTVLQDLGLLELYPMVHDYVAKQRKGV